MRLENRVRESDEAVLGRPLKGRVLGRVAAVCRSLKALTPLMPEQCVALSVMKPPRVLCRRKYVFPSGRSVPGRNAAQNISRRRPATV
jgi:hypothetical protein